MLRTLVALLNVVGSIADNPPVVDVAGLGAVKGIFVDGEKVSESPTNVSAFLGIPYAKPPLGDLRWRAPETHGQWTSAPLDGSKYGNCCVQTWPSYLPPNKTALSEDCLSLNVFGPTAALNGKQTLPVMFWIHGGAYTTGCGADYSGAGIIHVADLKVLMVSINYRLNVFGFLGSADLKPRTKDNSFGNYGIQDQRLAMQWTADNIGAFGGDASDITIFGESAGGSSVVNHLTQASSFPLYKKAIIESGTYQGAIALQESEARYASLKKSTKCQDITCLLGLTSAELNKSVTKDLMWGPTVDGVSLSDIPWNLIRYGDYNKQVPIMLGSNRDESALFALIAPINKLFPPQMSSLELDAILASSVGVRNVQDVKDLYDPSKYPYPSDLGTYSQSWWTAIRVTTDSVPGLGACGARNFSRSFHKGGTPAVFTYLFAHPTQKTGILPGSGPGSVTVPHGSEIVFVLAGVDQLQAGEEAELSLQMSRYWSNFAITGDPNGDALPKWSQYGSDGDVVQRLQTASEGGIIPQHALRQAACDYWDTHPSKFPAEYTFGKHSKVGPTALFV